MNKIVLAAIVDKKRPMPNPDFLAFQTMDDFKFYLGTVDENVVIVNIQQVPVYEVN